MKHETNFLITIIVAVFATMTDCGGGAPDPEPTFDYQTEILEVRILPDTVAVGDTVLFHCVIEDSLDPSFEFNWLLPDVVLIPVNGTIKGSKVRWKAQRYFGANPGEIVEASFGVLVDNGDESKDPVNETFHFYIKH
ncbi:MAG: hypothetical protein WD016_08810 [Balneolaceae bacterium]